MVKVYKRGGRCLYEVVVVVRCVRDSTVTECLKKKRKFIHSIVRLKLTVLMLILHVKIVESIEVSH